MVGGLLTSIFWDVKLWALIGLAFSSGLSREATSAVGRAPADV
jgi:hypothetical protein